MQSDDEETAASNDRHSRERLGRRVLSGEFLIATLALLASSVASFSTILQTRTIGNQLSASVWPYLTNGRTLDQTNLIFAFTNQGLGPAIVRTFELTLDGRRMSNWTAVRSRLASSGERLREPREVDFGSGSVVRPGETMTLVDLRGGKATTAELLQADVKRIETRVCYCSLLKNCWTLNSADTEPEPVRSCGSPGPIFSQ